MNHLRLRQLALACALLIASHAFATTAQIEFGPVCGSVGTNSATFTLGVTEAGTKARLLVSTNENWETPVATAWPTVTEGARKFTVQGLQPATKYFYAVELDGQRQKEATGRFRTLPVGPASFQFAFGNSLRSHRPEISGLTVATQHDILFFLNTGDLFYKDIAVNDPTVFRAAYRDAFNRQADRQLLRHAPLVYIWDDHDFGPNNADGTAPGKEASRQVYREMVPHYPLAAGAGNKPIQQAFSVGRVRFILTDLRSERSPAKTHDCPDNTMMGREQFAWFKKELAESATRHALVIWVSSVPWTAKAGSSSDHWGGYTHERTLIADWVKQHKIQNLLIIAGDAHSTAADDGRNGDYATSGGAPIPTVIAAPLDNTRTSFKGGPYSQGQYAPPDGENMFGLATIRDDGQQISFHFSGRNNRQEEKISLEFKPPAR